MPDETEALGLARELDDTATEARALNALGLLESQSDPAASLTMLDRACELARTAPDAWCLSEATQNVGWSLIQMGQLPRRSFGARRLVRDRPTAMAGGSWCRGTG